MKLIGKLIKIIPVQTQSKIHFFLSKIIPDSTILQYLTFLPKLNTWAKHHNERYYIFENRYHLYDYLNFKIVNNNPIDFLEFGVFKGESINYWGNINSKKNSRFYGFDSFEGLPQNWKNLRNVEKGHFDLKGNIPSINDNRISFIKGFFQDTLDLFLENYNSKNRLVVHLDCDLYSSTLYALTRLHERLKKGTILIFDEFNSVLSEFRALEDYCSSYLKEYKILAITRYFKQIAIEII